MSIPPASSRRRFLQRAGLSLAGGGMLASGLPGAAWAALPERRMALHNLHTGESVRTVYFAEGRYVEEGLQEISRLLRDWRTDEMIEYDPAVLDIVGLLHRRVGADGPVAVFSGYRSPATNAMLRRTQRGVAKNSLHMQGKAIDLQFPGVPLERLHQAALELQAGGVGYYPASDFLHVDSGPVRNWAQPVARRRARSRASASSASRG